MYCIIFFLKKTFEARFFRAVKFSPADVSGTRWTTLIGRKTKLLSDFGSSFDHSQNRDYAHLISMSTLKESIAFGIRNISFDMIKENMHHWVVEAHGHDVFIVLPS